MKTQNRKDFQQSLHEIVGELIRANWHRGHVWLARQAPVLNLIQAWPRDVEASLSTLAALILSDDCDVATRMERLSVLYNLPSLRCVDDVDMHRDPKPAFIPWMCRSCLGREQVREMIRANCNKSCCWLVSQASLEALIRAWPYDREDTLATYKNLVHHHSNGNLVSAWQSVPAGTFMEAFVQAVPAARLPDLDFVSLHQLDALLTVPYWDKGQLLMEVLLGRARDAAYLAQVEYFALRAFKRPLTRKKVLKMNQDCGTSQAGVDFLIKTGFLCENDNLRVHT